jgi:hypothetical protein
MKPSLRDWLMGLANRPGGDILAVQTLRNAIMAASVLASAAMVALMGVLATAHLHPRLFGIVAAMALAASAAAAVAAIVKLARAGFECQMPGTAWDALAHSLVAALRWVSMSAALLAVALAVAALSLLA